MNVEKLFHWVQWMGAALLLTLVAGCGSGAAEETTGGTISMPLTGTSPSGAQYRLAAAVFEIQGPESSTIASDPDEPVLNVDVAPGAYTITLQNGWSVQRFTGGAWTDVTAVLTSNPTVALTVMQGFVSEATFRFGVGDEFISFGKGRVSIGAEFDDDLAPGAVITLAAFDRGWWNADGVHPDFGNTWTGAIGTVEFRSFFMFDVSMTPVGVTAATLRLEIERVDSSGTEAVTVSDVSTDPAVLGAGSPGSAAGIAVFDDLGSGATYGNFAVTTTSVGTIVDIPLSGSALADLNAATTAFSVGVSVDVVEADQGVRFSALDEVRVHELVMLYPPP